MTISKNDSIKHISAATFFVFLNVFFLSTKVQAASTMTVVTRKIRVSDFVNLVENVFKWSLSVAGAIALFILIMGGIMYMTSSGDEQKALKAKKTFYWALGGLALIILAYGIGSVINKIFF